MMEALAIVDFLQILLLISSELKRINELLISPEIIRKP